MNTEVPEKRCSSTFWSIGSHLPLHTFNCLLNYWFIFTRSLLFSLKFLLTSFYLLLSSAILYYFPSPTTNLLPEQRKENTEMCVYIPSLFRKSTASPFWQSAYTTGEIPHTNQLSCKPKHTVKLKIWHNQLLHPITEVFTRNDTPSWLPYTQIYNGSNSTKSPVPVAGNVSEPSLMSQVGRLREVVCAWISVCVCSQSGGGDSIGLLT